jgi:hypothetical protein
MTASGHEERFPPPRLSGRYAVLMGTLSEHLGLGLALALGAIVSGSFWLATRFRHKCMAAGLECSPMGATETVDAGPIKH